MAGRTGAPHTVHRVRIRPGVGPHAATRGRRLARIAYQHLGPALERVLADVDDNLVVERVTVTFPADPDELDDQAVAMLWASLVRDSLERLRGTPPRPSAGAASERADLETADDQAGAQPEVPELATVVGALQRWARDGSPPTPAELELALSRTGLADRALAELSHPWRALARQLLDQAALGAAVRTPVIPATAAAERPPATTGHRPAAPAAGGHPASETTYGASPRPPAARAPARASDEAPVAPPPAPESQAARVAVSSWGGLVLLHHRLRPYLEQAADSEPGLDGIVVRTAALALLVDDPAATTDRLAWLLAGHSGWGNPDDPDPVVWRDPIAAAARAERLLRDFAGDLPGFGASSAGFVREQWLRRRALLLEDPPAVLLTLERRPLDLLLDRLPYPFAALRLPWTPPLFVRWEKL